MTFCLKVKLMKPAYINQSWTATSVQLKWERDKIEGGFLNELVQIAFDCNATDLLCMTVLRFLVRFCPDNHSRQS